MSSAPMRSADRVTAISGSVVTSAMSTVPAKLRDKPACSASASATQGSALPASSTVMAERPKLRQVWRRSVLEVSGGRAIPSRPSSRRRSCRCTLRSASRYRPSSKGLNTPM